MSYITEYLVEERAEPASRVLSHLTQSSHVQMREAGHYNTVQNSKSVRPAHVRGETGVAVPHPGRGGRHQRPAVKHWRSTVQ